MAALQVANSQENSARRDTAITETKRTELSTAESDRAKTWSLNETEWRRYQELMQGIRGSVSPATLSPIEVLGIHARDSAERRQYAELWALAMHEDAERILAFQRAYNEAAATLYPGQRLIDTARLDGGLSQATDLLPDDRILLRVKLDCPSCNTAVAKALKRLSDVAGIDIFVAASEQESIRTWAKAQGVRPEWVRSRRVTLNIDSNHGSWMKRDESPPSLYRKRGEHIVRLAYAAL